MGEISGRSSENFRSRQQSAGKGGWICPSCRTQNAGPLEAGCTHCNAGADAKKADTAAVARAQQAAQPEVVPDAAFVADHRTTFDAPPNIPIPPDGREEAYQRWLTVCPTLYAGGYSALQLQELRREAFMDGWVSSRAGTHSHGGPGVVLPTPPPAGPVVTTTIITEVPAGPSLLLYTAKPGEFVPEEASAPFRDTVIAALLFYVENQLGYGPIPGQLTADQVREVLAGLMPAEEIART